MSRKAMMLLAIVAVAVAAGLPSAVNGDVLHEPFQVGTVGSAWDGTGSGTGWSDSNWSMLLTDGTPAASGDLDVVAGLTFTGSGGYSLQTSGNAIYVDMNLAKGFRAHSAEVLTGTLWVSYLLNLDSATSQAALELFARGSTNYPSDGWKTSAFRVLGKTYTSGAGVTWWGEGETKGGEGALDTTYLLVAKFTPLATGGSQTATIWQITEAKFQAMDLSDGVSEADLDANNVWKATKTMDLGANGMTLNDDIGDTGGPSGADTGYIGFGSTYDSAKATFDEIRYGTTLGDVLPVVPEPATLGLLALGGAGLLALRRKRR